MPQIIYFVLLNSRSWHIAIYAVLDHVSAKRLLRSHFVRTDPRFAGSPTLRVKLYVTFMLTGFTRKRTSLRGTRSCPGPDQSRWAWCPRLHCCESRRFTRSWSWECPWAQAATLVLSAVKPTFGKREHFARVKDAETTQKRSPNWPQNCRTGASRSASQARPQIGGCKGRKSKSFKIAIWRGP